MFNTKWVVQLCSVFELICHIYFKYNYKSIIIKIIDKCLVTELDLVIITRWWIIYLL